MLTFPEVLSHQGVTVFPDDEDHNLFYLIPDRPRLVVRDGKPVFSALFWTDQGDGGDGAVAGLRGGSLKFDIDLAIADEVRDEVARQIVSGGIQENRREALIAAEEERRRRLARATGDAAPPAVEPAPVGPVRFGTVQFTDGTVHLLEESGGNAFVAWSSAGGKPSLMGDNNAAFALRLGPEGAAVWFKALEADVAALGVRFELTFQARLPSLQIRVWAGSHQQLDLQRMVERTTQNVDRGCDDADVVNVDVKSVTETLVEEGLISVEIVKGTAKISDEHVAQLRNAALTLIQDRVKEVIQHRIRGLTEEERRTSLATTITEEVTMFAELRLEQRDVIEWKANPQGTIASFLADLSEEERRGFLHVVDLSDPVVSTLEVPVSCDAAWDGSPAISRVIVDVHYPASPIERARRQSFTFAKDDPKPKLFAARRGPGAGDVDYAAKVYLVGAEEPVELPNARARGAIHVQVPLLGAWKVKLRPHPEMFTLRGSAKIQTLAVECSYKDEGAPDFHRQDHVIRATELDGVEIGHETFRRVDAPLLVKPIYHREDPPPIEGAVQRVWIRPGAVPIVELPLPYPDRLRVSASVAPNLPGLKKVVIDVDYEDPQTGFGSQAQLLLDAEGDWSGATTLVQQRKEHQQFRYRYALHGEDQLFRSPPMTGHGDQELIVPLLAVTVHTDRLGLGTRFDRALVRLVYTDAANDQRVAHELFLTDAKVKHWLIPRVDPARDTYTYELELFPPTGDAVIVPAREARGTHVILQAPA